MHAYYVIPYCGITVDVFGVNRASIMLKKLPNLSTILQPNFSEFQLHYLNFKILYIFCITLCELGVLRVLIVDIL